MNKYTIFEPATKEIVIEKSRFICTLSKVHNDVEAQNFIKEMKKKYWDATHNCSAYVLGQNSTAERSNDDGEPSGTAGLPMLEVLRKNSLYDVAAVVTRYFGGIKLGAGGLIRAYTMSVAEAVQAAGFAQVVEMGHFSFLWNVADVGKVLNVIYRQQLFKVEDVAYEQRAKLQLLLPLADKNKAEGWLTEALQQKIELTEESRYGEEQKITKI